CHFFCFFRSLSPHLYYLYSFPTRRSSDLDLIIRMKSDDYSDVMTELMDKLVGSIGGRLRLRRQNDTTYLDYLDTLEETSDQEIIDRKSTRLNSSHVSISYAVFCLKKKIMH